MDEEQGKSCARIGMLLALTEKPNESAGSSGSQLTPSKKPARSGKWRGGKKTREFVFAVGDADKSNQGGWILEIGASRHLVRDAQLLV